MGLARPESVAPVNFASESNDLQVWQRAILDETLDALLDVFSADALEGGVNASLNLDSHGKSWSYLILGMALDP
jgi:hypothetical protein